MESVIYRRCKGWVILVKRTEKEILLRNANGRALIITKSTDSFFNVPKFLINYLKRTGDLDMWKEVKADQSVTRLKTIINNYELSIKRMKKEVEYETKDGGVVSCTEG